MKVDKVYSTDVLVIGGAGAAIMAAITAKKNGADVTVISKGRIGKSGNTIMIGGGFGIDGESAYDICGEEKANRSYTKEHVFNTLINSSFYLSNQKICRSFVENAPKAVKECLGWAKRAKQRFAFVPVASLWQTSGRSFGNTVKEGLNENPGIRVFEDTICVDLLKKGDCVCGAVSVDVYTGEIIQLNAKSVIIATGGYQPYSLKNTISDMTGDGVAMAVRAGAEASDMEFLLFIPTAIKPDYIKGSIIPYLMTIPVYFPLRFTVRDMDGEEIRIEDKYKAIPPTSKMNKIIYAYLYGKRVFEKYEQYGNMFYYDFSDYDEPSLRNGFKEMAARVSLWHRKDHYNGVDLNDLCDYILKNDMKLEVGLGNEYSMGGIVINESMETKLKGLYAAGEVTSGLFGAFRSADGLTEMLAHGITAGEQASEYVKGLEGLEPDNLESVLAALCEPLEQTGGENPLRIIQDIESNNDEGFSFFRTDERLKKAEREIRRLKERRPVAAYKGRAYNSEWINSIFVRNLIMVSEMGITAALVRKESRGTHMRYDYPMVDNENYTKNIVFHLEDGELKHAFKNPVVTNIPSPTKNFDTVLDYVLEAK